jgi:hypothetical protein
MSDWAAGTPPSSVVSGPAIAGKHSTDRREFDPAPGLPFLLLVRLAIHRRRTAQKRRSLNDSFAGECVADCLEVVVVSGPCTRARVLRERDPKVLQRLLPTAHARAQGSQHVVDRPVLWSTAPALQRRFRRPARGRLRVRPLGLSTSTQRATAAAQRRDAHRSRRSLFPPQSPMPPASRQGRSQVACRRGPRGLPVDGENRRPRCNHVKLLARAGARAGLIVRLDHGLACLRAVGVDCETSDRERPPNRPPDAVVKRNLLELAQTRDSVPGHAWRMAGSESWLATIGEGHRQHDVDDVAGNEVSSCALRPLSFVRSTSGSTPAVYDSATGRTVG